MKKKIVWLDRALVLGPRYTLCTSKEQFDSVLKELNAEDYPRDFLDGGADCVHHFENQNGSPICVVCLDIHDIQRDSIEMAIVIVHESVHIWQRYIKYIGEEAPSKEFEAYSIEAIAEGLMRAYAEQSKK